MVLPWCIAPSLQDSEVRKAYQRSLEKQGIKFKLGTKVGVLLLLRFLSPFFVWSAASVRACACGWFGAACGWTKCHQQHVVAVICMIHMPAPAACLREEVFFLACGT
jgi:hypothetical protein